MEVGFSHDLITLRAHNFSNSTKRVQINQMLKLDKDKIKRISHEEKNSTE